jgi:hypothetical protein
MTFENDEREWLAPDGLGGFAMGTVSGVRRSVGARLADMGARFAKNRGLLASQYGDFGGHGHGHGGGRSRGHNVPRR